MATRTQRPTRPHSTSPRSLSKSPRIGTSSKHLTNMQVRSRAHTRDEATAFQNVRDISMIGSQCEGQYTLRAPPSGSMGSKATFPKAPRSHGLALGFGSESLHETNSSYLRPRPSGDAKLRGVFGQFDIANISSPETDRISSRAYAPTQVGSVPASASAGALMGSIASSAVEPPASASMPLLTTALQRLKDSDMETFKLERACGMAPDPARLARLAGAFSTDEEVLGVLSGMGGSRRCDTIDAMDGIETSTSLQLHSPSSPQTPHMNRKYALQQPSAQRLSRASPPPAASVPPTAEPNSKLSRHNTLPSSSSAPAGLNRSGRTPASRSALRTERVVIPPFVPTQSPFAQLKRLEDAVKTHGSKWGIGSSRSRDNAAGRFDSLKSLIGIDELLVEHSLDARLEFIRSEMERQSEGIGYHERFSTIKGKEKALGRADPTWRAPMCIVDSNDPQYRVFGQPLHRSNMYASCVASMAGYQHDLPIVVFACVEELYRTGMTVPGLFRSPPDRTRHTQLINAFDFGPGFGKSVTLAKESTADICALLLSFIERMPRALWNESLYTALWKLCVKPSLQREKEAEDAERKGMEEDDASHRRHSAMTFGNFDGRFGRSETPNPNLPLHRTRSSSLDSSSLYSGGGSVLDAAAVMNIHSRHNPAVLTAAQRTIAAESAQIDAARALFRLLPRAQFSLLSYLVAFFTQIPLSPQNQMTYEDIARIFAVPIFLGRPPPLQKGSGGVPVSPTKEMREEWQKKKEQARSMMLWVLRRWSHISPGLFAVENDADQGNQDEPMDFAHTSSTEASESASSRTSSSFNDWPQGPQSPVDVHNSAIHEHRGAKEAMSALLDFKDNSSYASREHSTQRSKQAYPANTFSTDTGTSSFSNAGGAEVPPWKSLVDRDICELRQELDKMKRRLDHLNALSNQDVTMLPI